MTTNRSAEELAMRDAIEAWGRARWPSARVVHELVVGQCRIDMAFVSPDHLAGVEIKGPKDRLDRLQKQVAEFRAALPEFWIAIDQHWTDKIPYFHRVGKIEINGGKIFRTEAWYRPDRSVTVQTLDLLWRDELHAIAARRQLFSAKSRASIGDLKPAVARALTGDEIVAEVCRELRARSEGRMGKAFWKADPPIVGRVAA